MNEIENIKLTNVTTTYEGADTPVIHNVNLSINRGEFIIIGGQNGSGKTTLLETIAGLLPIVTGSVKIDGENIKKSKTLRKKLGYVIQNFAFDAFTPFTVEEVILMARYGQLGILKYPRDDDHAAVDEVISLLKLNQLRTRKIGKLSGGQQQRVLIAHNLAKKPNILLLDEPFSNLDLVSREQVCNILCNLADSGITIIIVSHAFDVLPDRDIRAVVMKNGRIIFDSKLPSSSVAEIVRHLSLDEKYV